MPAKSERREGKVITILIVQDEPYTKEMASSIRFLARFSGNKQGIYIPFQLCLRYYPQWVVEVIGTHVGSL